ncbi:MAG: hypothetical protein ACFCUL_09060, partial [Flavobacteriaceae bacterium]
GWEVAPNAAGLAGDPKSIFFAGVDGSPDQFFHPVTNRPSLYWDYEGRTVAGTSYGALAIGVDGAQIGATPITLSNQVKVHIAEQLPNQIAYSILLHNSGEGSGSGTGILFASDRYNNGKGALIFERRDNFGIGDFHFVQNNTMAIGAPSFANDKTFTVTKEKNIRLYGGIDIDGIGLGTAGQVLSSTGTGLAWVANTGGGGGLFDANTISGTGVLGDEYTLADNAVTTAKILDANITPIKIQPSITIGQVLTTTATGTEWSTPPPGGSTALFDTNTISGTGVLGDEYTLADNAVTTAKILDANVTNAKIAPAPALAIPEKQILVTNPAGTAVAWEPLGSTGIPTGSLGSIFFSDGAGGLLENNAQISFDNIENRLNLGGGFASNQQKLNVNGNTRATAFLGAVNGANPAFRFFDDADTGMYSPGVDQLALKAGDQDIISIRQTVTFGNEITANGAFELQEELIDIDGFAGTNGQVLSSTGSGVVWKEPVIFAMGKINPGGADNIQGANLTGSAGNYTITFPIARPDNDYIIQLTVTGNNRIFVTNQTINSFDITILDENGLPVVSPLPIWYFTVSDF